MAEGDEVRHCPTCGGVLGEDGRPASEGLGDRLGAALERALEAAGQATDVEPRGDG